MSENKWQRADDFSDKIVDLVNAERNSGFSPVQILAGQMLAMLAMVSSAPTGMPQELTDVANALTKCLQSMQSERGLWKGIV